MIIDIEKLRRDLIDYYGTVAQIYPVAIMELSQVENCSEEELINIALKLSFNLNDYEVNNSFKL